VNPWLALGVLVGVTATTVTAMLLVRRGAPAGSRFSDGDRAAGVFGVLATGFSVLLGFIIFLAFQAYDDTRAGAERESVVVAQMVQTAQLMPGGSSQQLTGELICYARSVVGTEWDAVGTGRVEDSLNPWGAKMFRTVAALEPATATEQSAYDRWMSQTSERQDARNDRVHTAQGIIPTPLWLALSLICAVIFGFLLFFADSAERATTQAMLMGSVTVVITLLMLLLGFFDNPHGEGLGALQPSAMERSLLVVDAQLDALGSTVTPPCDALGNALSPR
jgi:FtsH-binding integral membrane protein